MLAKAAFFSPGHGVVGALSILLAALLLAGQGIAELLVMRHTGSLRRKWTPEWTFQAVNLPYRMMIVAGTAEYLLTDNSPTTAAMVAGVTVTLMGIALRVACHLQIRERFSPYVELTAGHQLTDVGFYSHIRHPMYLGTLIIAAGLPLTMGSLWAAGFAVLTAVGLQLRITKEEKLLRKNLPGYGEYAARTWCLVPGIW